MTSTAGGMSVSDLIRADDDDGLHALFQEVMESGDSARMAALAEEFLAAYLEFDKNTGDSACLENAAELLRAIAHLAKAPARSRRRSARATVKAVFVRGTEVIDPDTGGAVGISIYKTAGGGMVGIDSSYLEQDVGPVYSPFDRGAVLELVDEQE